MNDMTNPKLRILETAEQLFAIKGFDGVTVREIAEQAHVNVAMINYYFRNKDGLYLGIVESYLEAISAELEKVLRQETDPRQRIKLFIKCYIEFLFPKSQTAHLFFRFDWQDGTDIERFVSKYFAKNQVLLVQTIREGIEAGYFIPVDPQLTVVSLLGMILWHFAGAPIFTRIPGMENYLEGNQENFAQHTWELFIRGISPGERLQV